jgi:hypothetical protein
MAVCLWVLVCSAQFLESSELFTYGTAPDRDPFQYAGTTETTSENNIETRTLTLYQMKPEDAKNMLALFFPETTLLASPAEKKIGRPRHPGRFKSNSKNDFSSRQRKTSSRNLC